MGSPCPCSHLCPSGSRSFLPYQLLVPSPGVRRIKREVVHTPPSMNTRGRGSSGQKRNAAGEVAADELCFSPPRRIECGLFDSPSMNTRSCLSTQKRKKGPGSRPVRPDKEEVANDDDDYTSDPEEEATIKFSFPDRKSVKKISDS